LISVLKKKKKYCVFSISHTENTQTQKKKKKPHNIQINNEKKVILHVIASKVQDKIHEYIGDSKF
jgi:hypothetical protein